MGFDLAVTRRLGSATIACRFVAEDGLTVLFGPSGVGKTSVLNMVAGLLTPDEGHIRVGGRMLFRRDTGERRPAVDLPPEVRRAGYVFQDARLFPHLSVRANLVYGGGEGRLAETAALLGIGHLLDRRPRTLSGGEARRVAIGRALLADPAFLLLDEPMSFLDRARREEILTLIEQLRDAAGLPILLVTHDRAEAERLGTRIVPL
jgi:molybdate transport system ATP-binding protein